MMASLEHLEQLVPLDQQDWLAHQGRRDRKVDQGLLEVVEQLE